MESEIHQKFKDKQVIVVGIGAGEGKSGLKKWAEKHKLTYLLADDSKVAKLFAGSDGSIPRNVVIGPDRKVLVNEVGANVPGLVKTIEEAIAARDSGKADDAGKKPDAPGGDGAKKGG